MLEWLKTILGDNYSEEIDTAISGEIGKGFVSKANYDQRNTAYKDLQKQIAERDTQLEELKKVDTAKLQEEIVKLQTTNKTAKEDYEKKIADLQKEYAVDTALNKVGARNIKAYPYGTVITITETSNNWGKTSDGWVSLEWVEKI